MGILYIPVHNLCIAMHVQCRFPRTVHTQFKNRTKELLRFMFRFLVHILTEYFIKIIVWFIVGVSDSEWC